MGGRPLDARRLVLALHTLVSTRDSSGDTALLPTIYKALDPGPLLQGPPVNNVTSTDLTFVSII